jgi:hypothetical protein
MGTNTEKMRNHSTKKRINSNLYFPGQPFDMREYEPWKLFQ